MAFSYRFGYFYFMYRLRPCDITNPQLCGRRFFGTSYPKTKLTGISKLYYICLRVSKKKNLLNTYNLLLLI